MGRLIEAIAFAIGLLFVATAVYALFPHEVTVPGLATPVRSDGHFGISTLVSAGLGGLLMWAAVQKYRRRADGPAATDDAAPEGPPRASVLTKVGKFFMIVGHLVVALTIGGVLLLLAQSLSGGGGGASGIPIIMGVMLAAVSYGFGIMFKHLGTP